MTPFDFFHTKYDVQSHNITQDDVAKARVSISRPHRAKVMRSKGYGIPENIDTPQINAIINMKRYELLTPTYSIIASVPT